MTDETLEGRVARLLSKRPVSWRRAAAGYSGADRWVVSFEGGSTAFVKMATSESLATRLRREHHLYWQMAESFMARVLAWEGGSAPLLVLEDFSGAHWPPPWRAGDIDRVRRTLDRLHSIPVPAGVQPLADREELANWPVIEANAAAFLSLGLASRAWLEAALPVLLAAEKAAAVEGGQLIHGDFWSNNVCLLQDRVVIVDWDHACRANGELDLAGWLPSLYAEGGPPPSAVMPGQGEFAAYVAGFFAARAGLPPRSTAPLVRGFQLLQLRVALQWAIDELGLLPLDG